MDHSSYNPPTALTILAAIFLGLCALVSFWIASDIVRRRGWRTMMGVMIPVYILNALYLAPITLWVYLKYGRPSKPESHPTEQPSHCSSHKTQHESSDLDPKSDSEDCLSTRSKTVDGEGRHCSSDRDAKDNVEKDTMHHSNGGEHGCHETSKQRSMFATITVGVCHCGAGCLLGDIVGEWLVYGTNATIHGQMIWPAFLVDFAFALLFGILFQYFSIAPMSGDYSFRAVWRALKADVLSLTSFQVGLYGWMAIYQVAIWDYKLEVNTATYWWMMQVGMFFGHWTAVPMNWWLLKQGIKEPCC